MKNRWLEIVSAFRKLPGIFFSWQVHLRDPLKIKKHGLLTVDCLKVFKMAKNRQFRFVHCTAVNDQQNGLHTKNYGNLKK